jgi:hypothetical protein
VRFNIYYTVTGSQLFPREDSSIKPLSPPLVGGDKGEREGSLGLSDIVKRVFSSDSE